MFQCNYRQLTMIKSIHVFEFHARYFWDCFHHVRIIFSLSIVFIRRWFTAKFSWLPSHGYFDEITCFPKNNQPIRNKYTNESDNYISSRMSLVFANNQICFPLTTLMKLLLLRTWTCIRTFVENNLNHCNTDMFEYIERIFLPVKQHEMYSRNYIFIE